MEKLVVLRAMYRSACFRSSRFAAITNQQLRHWPASRSLYSLSSPAIVNPPTRIRNDFRSPFAMGIGNRRYFSEDVTHFPVIKDPEILSVFKDLMAEDWGELSDRIVYDTKSVLSKETDDKTSQEVLKNVFRAAEAVEEFGGMIISLKMELDDSIGLSGEEVKPLPDDYSNALRIFYQRYSAYLDSFGPDEGYLRKKVENELGSKMIFLKMRCSGLGSEWGKVTVLGTSGLAGSYVEQRA